MPDAILEMHNITKTFPGVIALDNVNLTVEDGAIVGLVGENGAGKSTLMKVLSGIYPIGDYEGEIHFEQKECRFKGITDSEDLGIVIIHQELALIPYLSIAENIFMGNEQAKHGVIDWHATRKKAKELLKRLGWMNNLIHWLPISVSENSNWLKSPKHFLKKYVYLFWMNPLRH